MPRTVQEILVTVMSWPPGSRLTTPSPATAETPTPSQRCDQRPSDAPKPRAL